MPARRVFVPPVLLAAFLGLTGAAFPVPAAAAPADDHLVSVRADGWFWVFFIGCVGVGLAINLVRRAMGIEPPPRRRSWRSPFPTYYAPPGGHHHHGHHGATDPGYQGQDGSGWTGDGGGGDGGGGDGGDWGGGGDSGGGDRGFT